MDYKPLYKQNSLHNSKLDMHINEEKKKLQTSHNFQDENFTSRTNKRQIEGQVFAKPLQDEQMEHFTRVEKKKTTQDIEFISHCLKSHFVFYRLSDSDRKKLAQAFFYCQLSKDDYIIKQGSDASTFFILEQGKVQIIVNKESKRILSPGDGFGELALLYNSKRTASCKSMETCTLWGIDRVKFKHVVKEMSEKEFKENLQFIENVQYFQNLTRQQKDNIASVLIEQKFNKNQDIINEDDIASSFYIIKSGTVSVMKDGKELKTLSKGSSFGESALLTGEQFRTMTIKAKEETFCLALGRDMLTKILGNKVEEIIWRNIAKWTLQKTSFGSSLEEMQIEHLLDHVHVLPIRDGDKVVPKGAYLQDQIVFILQGEVYKIGTKDKVGEKFGRIGESELLNNINQTQSVDLIGQKSCVIGILKNSSIIKELGCTLKEQVDRNIKMRQIVSQKEQNRKQTLDKLQLRDLKALKHLGAGQFGNVYLVKTVHSSEVYALKCINKQQVVQQHLEKYVMEEKTILEDINFPFIMRFYRSMQDNYHVYLLLEFIEGMELFDVIREMGLLSTFDCQFYIGSIILGIEYMHKNQIIYRDIKPENIMVTNQGYPKIVDLGTAHKFRGKKLLLYTIQQVQIIQQIQELQGHLLLQELLIIWHQRSCLEKDIVILQIYGQLEFVSTNLCVVLYLLEKMLMTLTKFMNLLQNNKN
ncbi:Protein kinase-like domain [Pseudocohnilembus persalinus]|uniref:cGMP-dependent protein kinase n=1 Tax=Pseudocohnilembus persalinus TaxID=266149 RepID=A0A0V0R1B9_PSEPJ|nr:Protein kinase-like domain [Pseudocohnilembus persalinus]|eukprot:KRX08335.1 Protein kinase-like domain [Pseudocohnilembus persalinus]